MNPDVSVAGVVRRDDTVLLMRRLPGGSVGGLWEFPGGKADIGEHPVTALKREWLEETGLNVAVGNELIRGEFDHNGRAVTLIAYEVFLPAPDAVPDLREHDAFQWVGTHSLEEIDLVDSDRIISKIL